MLINRGPVLALQILASSRQRPQRSRHVAEPLEVNMIWGLLLWELFLPQCRSIGILKVPHKLALNMKTHHCWGTVGFAAGLILLEFVFLFLCCFVWVFLRFFFFIF